MDENIKHFYDKFTNLFENDNMNINKDKLIQDIIEKLESRENFKIQFKHQKYTSYLILKYKDRRIKIKNLAKITLFEIELTDEQISDIISNLKHDFIKN